MTKKSLGYVELEWTCPNCGGKNSGSVTVCTSCGAAQPEDVQFEQPAQETLVTDQEKLEQAKAGPDIHCPFCGTRNRSDATICSHCAGELTGGTARQEGSVVGAHQTAPVADVKCGHCGTMNVATAHRCTQCGAAIGESAPRPTPAATSAPKRGNKTWVIVLGGVLLVACIAIILLFTRTEEVAGVVSGVAWERSVGVEALGPVQRDNWHDQIPGGAVVGNCSERLRRTQEEPAPNSVEVCGTPYTVDEGTGFGSVVQDCIYEVYEDYCTYTVEEWREIDRVTAGGADYRLSWPEPQLQAGQRAGSRNESYEIRFDGDGRAYEYATNDADLFLQCEIGSRWILDVNTLNAVVSIQPDN